MKSIVFAFAVACAFSAAAEVRICPTDVNVRDFGAKGDGVTDDTAAIQAASDKATKCAEAMRVGVAGRNCKRACQTDGPMPRLVFPAGTYLVTRPVFFRRDHQIYGFDGATVKAASSDIDVFVFVGTMRHFVTGLTMEGGARQFLVETHNSESANFKARDCVFRNASVTAVDSHSYRLPNAPDRKKRITVGTYRFDKEKGCG